MATTFSALNAFPWENETRLWAYLAIAPTLLATFFMIWSGISHFSASLQRRVLISSVVSILIFILLRLLYPTQYHLSSAGTLSSDSHPLVVVLGIAILSAGFLGSGFAMTREMKSKIWGQRFLALTIVVVVSFLILVTKIPALVLIGTAMFSLALFLMLLLSLNLLQHETGHQHKANL